MANPSAKTASKNNGNNFYNSNTKSNGTNDSKIAFELIAEQGEAAQGENSRRVNRSFSTTLIIIAAGVRNPSIRKPVHLLPVTIVLYSTARELILNQVPGCGDSFKPHSSVVLDTILHVLGDLILQVSLKSKGSNASCNLGDENEEEDSAVCVDEALVLLTGTAASKQSDDKDGTSQNLCTSLFERKFYLIFKEYTFSKTLQPIL